MVSSLEDCRKLKEKGINVQVAREVCYYALIDGIEYRLAHDWDIAKLEDDIWRKSNVIEDGDSNADN